MTDLENILTTFDKAHLNYMRTRSPKQELVRLFTPSGSYTLFTFSPGGALLSHSIEPKMV